MTYRKTLDREIVEREVLRTDAGIVQFRERRRGIRPVNRYGALPALTFGRWARGAVVVEGAP